jgi:hypothetical protein
MLPALRSALNTFTQRADIIIRQLSYIHTQGADDVVDLCRKISNLDSEQQDFLLLQHGLGMTSMKLAFIDPSQIQLRMPWQKTIVRSEVEREKPLDVDAQKALFVQQALDRALIVQGSSVREYVHAALMNTGRINSRQLTANNMAELLSLAHAIEVGALNNFSAPFYFQVEQDSQWLQDSPRIHNDEYFVCRDEFVIALIEKPHE